MSIHEPAKRNHNAWWAVGDLAHWLLIVTLSTLKWIGIALIAATVALLVMVSILWGPTPLYLSLPSAGLWLVVVALLALGPPRFGRWRTQLGAALGFFAIGLLTVVMSQVSAYTPPIVGAYGKSVPDSISSL